MTPTQFNAIMGQFEAVNQRLGKVETFARQCAPIMERIEGDMLPLGDIEQWLKRLDQRFVDVDHRFGEVDRNLEKISAAVGGLQSVVSEHVLTLLSLTEKQ